MGILAVAREWMERAYSKARTRSDERAAGERVCEILEMEDLNESRELRRPMADDTKIRALSAEEWEIVRKGDTERAQAAANAKTTDAPLGQRWREDRDPHVFVRWRCVDGQMQHRDDLHGWMDDSSWQWGERWGITPERTAMWAGLYERPTETIATLLSRTPA